MTNKCTTCPTRSTCVEPCKAVAALLPTEQTGRISGLERRNYRLYGEKLEKRRAYVRFLLDWREILSPRARQAFDLRYNDGLTLTQIAQSMGITLSSASSLLRRGRAKILKRWRKQG